MSERARHRWVDSVTTYSPTGAVPAEFICSAFGFFLLLLLTYLTQYAMRHGYLEPPGVSRHGMWD